MLDEELVDNGPVLGEELVDNEPGVYDELVAVALDELLLYVVLVDDPVDDDTLVVVVLVEDPDDDIVDELDELFNADFR